MIALQKPDATRVAGFRAWLKLGYCVRRGEKALKIWVPMPPSRRKLDEWRAAGADPKEKPRTGFRLGPVFDRSQVEELPPPAAPVPLDPPMREITGDDLRWAWEPLIGLAEELGSVVLTGTLSPGVGGMYEPSNRTITISDAGSVNRQIAVLVHELGHALVRAEPADDDVSFTYAEEELVVESVAYTVCGSLGIDVSGASIPYLASWSESGSLETIEKAAGTIDRIARRIEEAVESAEEDTAETVIAA